MEKAIERIVIVGGGTAGWLSAAYLRRALPAAVHITLIESPNVPTVGVGEATIPTLRNTMEFVGLDEAAWMTACKATAKLGIRFDGWKTGAKDDRYFHPFTTRQAANVDPLGAPHFPISGQGFPYALFWMSQAAQGKVPAGSFARMTSPIPALCDVNRFRHASANEDGLVYAYQFDAGLFAAELARHCVAKGVAHKRADVVGGERSSTGISHVVLEGGETVEGDFFVDCTGFRGVLISKLLDEPFVSDSRFLINDSAIALQADLIDDEEGDRPFTVSTAMDAGWSWRVPLRHRFGNGYVFSSAHISPDDAEKELRESLGSRAAAYDARLLKLRVGRRRRLMVDNCVAIGLSGAFIEPLESTAIFFAEFQLASLLHCFPSAHVSPAIQDRYNSSTTRMYDEMRDFVALHYVTTQRKDTAYWRAIKNEVAVPEGAREILSNYAEGLLPVDDFAGLRVFRLHAVMCILSGMGLVPHKTPALAPMLSQSAAVDFANGVEARTAKLLATLPLYNPAD